MAWAFVAHRGDANNKTSGTTLSFLLNGSVPAGDVLIVRCATDALAGDPTGQTTNHQKVEAWQGLTLRGTFTKIMEYTRTGNVTVSLWLFTIFPGNSFDTTVSIRLTLVTAVTAKVMGAEDFSQAGNQAPRLVGNTAIDGSSTTPSVTLSGLVGGGTYLFLGHVGIEGPNGDTFTQDADYSNNTSIGTTGGGATSNVASRFGRRVATLSSDTYNPTLGTSRAWVDMLAALEEQTFVSNTGIVPWDGLGVTKSQRQVTDLFERTPSDVVAPGWTIDQPDNVNAGIFFLDAVDSGFIGTCVMEVQQNGAASGAHGFARRTEQFGADQFAEVKIAQILTILNWPSTYRVGIGVRCSGTKAAFTGYVALYRDTSGSQGVELRRFINESLANGGTVIGTWNGVLGQGQTWRLEIQGTEIRMKVGLTTVLTVQDTVILYWGQPAIVAWGTGPTDFAAMDMSRFTGGDLVLDWTLPYESLAPVANTGLVPWESVAPTAGVSQTAEIPWERLALASGTGANPWESLAQAMASGIAPWESLVPVLAIGLIPYEVLAGAASIGASPWEALARTLATGTIPWEALTAIATSGVVPWETLMALAVDGTIPWEAITALQVIAQSASIPYESLAQAVATSVIPWENIGAPKEAIQILLAVAMTMRRTNLHWHPRPSTLRALPRATRTYPQQERWMAVSATQRDTTVAIRARQIALQIELRSAAKLRDRTVVLAAVRRGTELATAHRDVAVRIFQHTTDTKFVG